MYKKAITGYKKTIQKLYNSYTKDTQTGQDRTRPDWTGKDRTDTQTDRRTDIDGRGGPLKRPNTVHGRKSAS